MSERVACPLCQTENSIRAIHCIGCGHNLRDDLTTAPSMTHFLLPPDASDNHTLPQRRAYFGRDAKLSLRVISANEVLACDLSSSILTLGRKSKTGDLQHVDLSRFGAKELGVSRVHARLIRIHAVLVLEDNGALNGTMVNGERISPVKPCVLCHGDTLRLGNLELEVIYHK